MNTDNTLTKSNKTISNPARVLLFLLIVGAGFAGFKFMISKKEPPKKSEQPFAGALVETRPVIFADRRIKVHRTGTVQPREEITIIPQVSGDVTKVHPLLRAGGFINKSEILFELEDTDYRLACKNAEANLAKAELELASMRGKAEVARNEWERVGKNKARKANPLLLYEPQLKSAEAAREATLAALKQAELNLARTKIKAPFNCLVRSEQIDIGQYIRAGSAVGILTSTDAVEVIVPLRQEDLKWLDIPKTELSGKGSPATVQLTLDTQTFEWHGYLARTMGEVDPKGGMIRAAVVVSDPYGLAAGAEAKRDLPLGTFVEVILEGTLLENTAIIPAGALRDHSTVWLDNDGNLQIRPVTIAKRQRNEILISQGLTPGDQIIMTALSGAAEGMKLRTATDMDASESIKVQTAGEMDK